MTRHRLRFLALVAVLLVAPGCAATAGSGSDPSNPDQLELMTGWTAGSEAAGLVALLEEFASRHPDIEVIDASVKDGTDGEARSALDVRLDSGNPPDSFHASAGAGLDEYVAAGRLQDLTEFYAEHDLDAQFRDTFVDLLRTDGRLYSVPVDIHRAGVVWANTTVLREAGIGFAEGRTTVEYWLDDLEVLRAAGVEFPLAVGDRRSLGELFESVLIADLGPVVYKNLWVDADAWNTPALATAVDHLAQLQAFADPADRFATAGELVDEVIAGEVAYLVTVDTAAAQFEREGLRYGVQFSAFPAPGTAGVFDFVVDSFTLPVGAAHDDAAKDWLLVVASADAQAAATAANGAIPARVDVGADGYPAYQQTAITSARNDTVAPSFVHGVAASPSWTRAILDALEQFREHPRPDALVNALVDAATAAQDS